MKKRLVLLASTFFCMGAMQAKLLTFTNPSIHSLDGITYMIDGVAIHDMLIVIKKSIRLHKGSRVGTKKVGNYIFKGKPVSISDLARLEEKYLGEKDLADILEKAKQDFVDITKEFVDGIGLAKRLIIDLMEEFSEQRNKPDTIILSWGNAKSGGEEETFRKAVTNFKEFDSFLTDLTIFLKDLIHSCPNARQQYKEWYKRQKQSKAQ